MSKTTTNKQTQNNLCFEIDKALFEFYDAFGIDYEPTKMALTGQYYGFLGLKEFFVRFGYKGRSFTRVFASDLQSAKENLTELQKQSLFGIEKI